METVTDPKRLETPVLAIDDEPEILDLYRGALACEGGAAAEANAYVLNVCRDGDQAIKSVRRARSNGAGFAVVFLDLQIAGKMSGLDLGVRIRKLDPDAHFVIVTGMPADGIDDVGRRLPPSEKLLYLKKPLHPYEIRQCAAALGAKWRSEAGLRRTTAELQEKIAMLEQSRGEILDKAEELEQVNTQLMETNDALAVLARNIDSTRKEAERRMLQKTRNFIIPSIERLQQIAHLAPYRVELDLLRRAVENLTAEIATADRRTAGLSAAETRIAALIRNGLPSHEIARHLGISPDTVKTHRKNIRRKLALVGTGTSLSVHLDLATGPAKYKAVER